MKIWGKVLVCLWSLRLLFYGVLCSPSPKDEGGSQTSLVSEASELPPVLLFRPDVENSYGQLPTLSKLLSDHHQRELGDCVPGSRLDSKALRYMKRLYKMSTTKEGFPKINHLYNTVRLLTPCTEGKHLAIGQTKGDLRSPDFLFSLDRVTALEHLVKSVLLYSFDKPFSKSWAVTCTGNLVVNMDGASGHSHPNIEHAMTFHFQLGHKRAEIDVTSFIWPLIASNNRSVSMAVNIVCPNDQPSNSKQDPFNITRASLSLLLYLNDTSEQAYRTWDFLKHRRRNFMGARLERGPFAGLGGEAGKDLKQSTRKPRRRRDGDGQEENISVSIDNLRKYYEQYLFPQNECKLHDFRLQFSQLGWDSWIIAPHRYNPRYCKGDCPRVLRHRYGSPVHSMVQNLIHEKINPSVPRPSCIPAEYSPLSVLKVEPDGSIVYKEYADMIATKCTCR
ncbi:growth/differentiation factor 9 isoform X1 [Zootoca vivipara]|uniref:growth/differentiation factor 9 isoform X1 n=1 Tax=Zootoca vivipara TaxID=8524 RepID=UPI001591908F|nr:growth/differentiation factor 9 isoform X1 [Zootoca vivipara]